MENDNNGRDGGPKIVAARLHSKCSKHGEQVQMPRPQQQPEQNAHRPSTVGANNLVFSSVFPIFVLFSLHIFCLLYYCSPGSDGGAKFKTLCAPSPSHFSPHESCTALCLFASIPFGHSSAMQLT